MPEQKTNILKALPFVLKKDMDKAGNTPSSEPRARHICLVCGKGLLEYDGMLNLTCPHCGTSMGGCFT